MSELLSLFGLLVLIWAATEISSAILQKAFVWNGSSRKAALPVAAAFALGPYLVGLMVIIALTLLPGAGAMIHSLVLALLLGLGAFIAIRVRGTTFVGEFTRVVKKPCRTQKDLFFVLLLWMVGLLVNSLLLPVVQNDALEYLMVARDIFESGSLTNYPALSTDTRSGFFGPWTHPPLYVALLYLGGILQGDMDIPIVARFIAPWFAIASTFLVYALGSAYSIRMGLVAAIFFIGAPLFFLGADSALIDSLPASALLIALAVWGGADVRSNVKSIFLFGAVLGAGTWTHSQAVLFPVIFAFVVLVHSCVGLDRASNSARLVLLFLAGVLVSGIWPFLNNLRKLGVLISDNPAVFALEKLDWVTYFSMARGINTFVARLQYGVFKGLSSVESYGLVFWVAVPAFVWCCRRILRSGFKSSILRDATLLLAIYHAGVLTSIWVGTDLMIKNERYFLVILGPAALLASASIESVLRASLGTLWGWITYRLVGALLVANFVVVEMAFRVWPYIEPQKQLSWPDDRVKESDGLLRDHLQRMLLKWPNIRLINAMNDLDQRGSPVLSFRPADMFYSNRKMISYLDPILLPLYQEDSVESLAQSLLRLNVTYIHVPDYFTPPIYNTPFMELFTRSDLASLEVDEQGGQVYKMKRQLDTVASGDTYKVYDFSPTTTKWTRRSAILIGGRKAFFKVGMIENDQNGGLFHRDISNLYYNGDGEVVRPDRPEGLVPIPELGATVKVRLGLNGSGFVKIFMVEYDQLGVVVRKPVSQSRQTVRIGEVVLKDEITFSRVVRLDPRARYLRISLETNGTHKINISSARLEFGMSSR